MVVPASSLGACVNITILDDLIVERDEEFTVNLTYNGGQTGVTLKTSQTAVVTIFNDDSEFVLGLL